LPPEAGEKEVAMTVRLTEALKAQIERKARAADLSVNSWVVQALETAVEKSE
jgi:predicted HicB family RNase H-like nuclease